MHIYFPPSSFKRLPSDESMGGERLKVVPQSSVDVSKFFGSAESSDLLRHSSKDIAVIGTFLIPIQPLSWLFTKLTGMQCRARKCSATRFALKSCS